MAAQANPRKKKSPWKGKEHWIAIAVMAALGGLYFLDQKAPAPRDPDSQPPVSELVGARSSDVTAVEVKRASAPFRLSRKGSDWRFEAPGPYLANPESVNNWLKGMLEDATVSRVVEGTAESTASYGLDKPEAEVVLTLKNGSTKTLQLGKGFQAPGQSGEPTVFYAREARGGLFLLSSIQADDLRKKKIDDLRDRRLLTVAEDKHVKKVVLTRSAGTVSVERRGEDKWELTQPFKAPADSIDVNSLLSQLRTAEGDSFASNDAADLAPYGLDQPQLTVEVTDNKGVHRLLLGKQTPDGKVHAARQGSREVLLIAKATFDGLDKKSSDLRDRRLITLDEDRIARVEIVNPSGKLSLRRVGDEWEFADATDPKQKKAKKETVQQLLMDLRSTADRHVEETPGDLAKYGLDEPAIIANVSPSNGATQVLQIGKKTAGENYYARATGSAVFEVQPYVYNGLNQKRDALLDKPEAPAGNTPAGNSPAPPSPPPTNR